MNCMHRTDNNPACEIFFLLNKTQYWPDGANEDGECVNPESCTSREPLTIVTYDYDTEVYTENGIIKEINIKNYLNNR